MGNAPLDSVIPWDTLGGMLASDAIRHFGSQTRVAELLNVGRAAVSKWAKKGMVPPLHAARLHKITRGRLRFDAADYHEWKKG